MKLLKKILTAILTTTLALTLMTSTVFAAGENKITIDSKNSDGVDLKGFEYVIESDKLKDPVKVDFNDNTSFVLEDLEDGTYHIKETKTIDGYEKGKDYTIELPTKDGHTSIKLTPKHIKAQKPDENEYTKTSTDISMTTMGLGILFVVTVIIVFVARGKEKKRA